ncbi:MAG: diguanylate cyclase [Solirubrobacterales bacterium]|nr:diguanylate cyclase [Solirubrobacterales bacterium]
MEHYEDQAESATEQLLEHSWERRVRRASQRELLIDTVAGALFVAVAAGLLLGARGLHPHAGQTGPLTGTGVLLIVVYAIAARIEFPVGTGYVVPTQLILVPMLLVLPPAAVPAAVGVGMVLGNAVDWMFGRVPPRRLLSAVPDSWHAVAPAAVLLLAGSPTIGFGQLPLLAGAIAAGCLLDLVCSLTRMRLARAVPQVDLQIRVIAMVWTVDACLAPVGFLAAIATREHGPAILLGLPLVVLLWLLARDRSQRIDKAHHRLKLVEQERVRLQSAVRRLGDAFAAKLDLGGLLEILLHGSIEALDAAAGRLELPSAPSPVRLSVGVEGWLDALEHEARAEEGSAGPVQIGKAGVWRLSVPMRIAASPGEMPGSLWLVRADRAFEEDEIALMSELVAKAELAAAEIIDNQLIRQEAMTDPLTGLGNRRRLTSDLRAALEDRAGDAGSSLLLLFDLDGFKAYNDTFGHLAGDELLARLGARLRRAVDGFGRAYRLGGDEFCAHLDLSGIDPHALISTAARALTESGPEFTIRASLGVVLLPQEASDTSLALRLADERMYAHKRRRSTGAGGQASEVLLRAMRAKQPALDQHAGDVARLAARVARRLQVNGEALDEVFRAAQLHDIGKVGIPDAILNKCGGLSDSEWEFVRNHTLLGERILHGAPALRPIARLVRASHERWDGSGYPDRLRGEEIPLGARIVSVCDAYEAMISDRAYRAAVPHEVACQELRRCAGAQFDPAVVDAFLAVVEDDSEEGASDATRTAAAHVRTLLRSGSARTAA